MPRVRGKAESETPTQRFARTQRAEQVAATVTALGGDDERGSRRREKSDRRYDRFMVDRLGKRLEEWIASATVETIPELIAAEAAFYEAESQRPGNRRRQAAAAKATAAASTAPARAPKERAVRPVGETAEPAAPARAPKRKRAGVAGYRLPGGQVVPLSDWWRYDRDDF